MADLVLLLEFFDLDGLKTFLNAEAQLGQSRPKLSRSGSGERTIEAGGGSMLEINEAAGDFLLADAKTSGQGILHIHGASDPAVIVAAVARAARAGYAAGAWWPGEQDWAYMAVQGANAPAPNLYRISLPEAFEGYDHVTAVLAGSQAEIEARYPDWFAFKQAGQVPANEIDLRYKEHLDKGFVIAKADYEHLCTCANRVLVESTEQSRQGAGE